MSGSVGASGEQSRSNPRGDPTNLGNLWRRLAQPARVANWSLTSLQQVKTRGRVIKHARYYWLLLAESHLTRRLFGNMLRRGSRCWRRQPDRRPQQILLTR